MKRLAFLIVFYALVVLSTGCNQGKIISPNDSENPVTVISLKFDGMSHYVTVNSTISGIYTLEFWVNPAILPATLVTRAGASPSIVITSAGAITFDGVTTATDGIIQINQWKHIAITQNSGAFEIYANGVSVATGNSTLAVNGILTFGSALNGKLDDIRMWDSLRTPEEISENRNTEEPTGAESHLMLYLKLNNDFSNSGLGLYPINVSTPAPVFDSSVRAISR